ncbi:hypothetical protein BCR42DRAFT_29113 [Absidia repens]|uniref:Uncharacterized protein n=1 Tax=Absidia repens TaxID=90262 RepID=A0A1X2IIU4_9FUNG|nr:hypothetical protein BCR42DRAFT_29113 [Absidia repens]
MFEELQLTLQDYQGINEDLQSQLDKYRNSFVEVNKRWNGLESSINDYKERLVISEGKVTMLEAQQKADDHIKKQLEQQLDDCKAEMEQRLQDDGLIGMVQSLRDDPDDDDDDDEKKSEHLEELDHLDDEKSNINHSEKDDCNQQLLTDLKDQLHQMKLESEQQRHDYMTELEKEREQSSICRTKIYQVQAKLDEVESALKQAKIDEVEHALNLAKLNQAEDAAKKANSIVAPQLSATTLPPLTSSESSAPCDTKLIHSITRSLYLDHNAWILLLAFAFWLFV